MTQVQLAALYRYPVKSMGGARVQASPVSLLGLAHDRMWMVADASGQMITGRTCPEIVLIQATPAETGLALAAVGRPGLFIPNTAFTQPHPAQVWKDQFQAWVGAEAADEWISDFLGRPCRLMWTGSQPTRRLRIDDQVPVSFADGFPLLLANQASLDELSGRIGRPMAMERFRPNLVVSGAPAWAEDDWKRLRIGGVEFEVVKPCERCVFTTVDPETGRKSSDQEPLRTLATYRKTPAGVIFGQNLVARGCGVLEVGMPVELLA